MSWPHGRPFSPADRPRQNRPLSQGFPFRSGRRAGRCFPGFITELWRVLNACVNADKIILMQAANTGLTEGSTPNGNDYDRDIVIISTQRLDKLHLLDNGQQVLAARYDALCAGKSA